MKDEIIKKLLEVKWNLVIMAAFCFLFAVYMYVTPVEGGLGMFMITPHNGLTGLLEMLPWIGIPGRRHVHRVFCLQVHVGAWLDRAGAGRADVCRGLLGAVLPV